jgi:hypothetical protein
MAKTIKVNGATLDLDYFNENLDEAKSYSWTITDNSEIERHGHCIICGVAIPEKQSSFHYRSYNALLCSSCYFDYIKQTIA